jgi:8-oxo-dGTP pyrophosphatase MutT (NUDIX family)
MFFKARSVQQVAVLPFVVTEDGVKILLITTRDRGEWIVPKGWPESGLSLVSAAAAEAGEEAGVVGAIDETPLGTYSYRKRMDAGYAVRCHVFVYPMLVREHRLDWPEQDDRRLKWCSLEKASKLAREPELRRIFSGFANDAGAPLTTLASDLEDAPIASTSVDESRVASA